MNKETVSRTRLQLSGIFADVVLVRTRGAVSEF